ncbi:hypothetical protein V6N11_070815 [Hibiscus sabdariffa]|uniref:Uncharacterized protein n=2 Tax=Hibiscus sabdariffa TaxID=183260 RepID=A0ABR2AP53_9ROSI
MCSVREEQVVYLVKPTTYGRFYYHKLHTLRNHANYPATASAGLERRSWMDRYRLCNSVSADLQIDGEMGLSAGFAEVMAIKTTSMYSLKQIGYAVESDFQVALNWIVNPLPRPWRWWTLFDEIDRMAQTITLVQFMYVP